MIRADEYDYDKFLSDSSDDYPKYDEGLSQEQLDGVRESSFATQEPKDWRAERKYLQEKWGKSGARISTIEGVIRQSTGNPLAVKDADDWWDHKNSLGQDE